MKKEFLNLFKAFRLERPLIPLSSIMLVVGFADKITSDVLILMICCVLMYAVGGLINAKIDKDYEVSHPILIILVIFIISLFLSLSNYVILITVLASLLLGFIYSKYSRFFIFGDSIVLGLTHSTLPIIGAALLLSLSSQLTIRLTTFMFLSIALVAPMKNLNGIKDDKKRGYKTLMTKSKGGKKITSLLLDFCFVLLFLAYFIFNLGNKFLFVFVILLIIGGFIHYLLLSKKEVKAYRLARFVIILFSFAIVFDKVTNIIPVLISSCLVFTYLIYFFKR